MVDRDKLYVSLTAVRYKSEQEIRYFLHSLQRYMRSGVELHSFLLLKIDGGEYSASSSFVLLQNMVSRYALNRRLLGLRKDLDILR